MRTKSRSAFTMIEILTVIAIISILAGITVVGVKNALTRGRVTHTKALISDISSALANYYNAYMEYPPTNFSLVQPGGTATGVNSGCESLLQCLTTANNGGPFTEFTDDQLENLDGDQRAGNPSNSVFISTELFEIVDHWGNPLVYVRAAEYGTFLAGLNQYMDNKGATVTVSALPVSSKTGSFFNQTFLIWSFGPNELNENGDGDDIASWK